MSWVWLVAFYAFITVIFTWLWAIPFIWKKNLSKSWVAKAHALAAALMLAASFWLIYEWIQLESWDIMADITYFSQLYFGVSWSAWAVVLWILIGLIFIIFSDKIISRYNNLWIHHLKGADAKKVIMIIGIMTIHSFTEWVAVWVSFAPSEAFGIFIAIAIAVHNIPEWLAISTVLVPKWYTRLQAAWWSIFSSIPQLIMAIPAFLFVQYFAPILPIWLWFAAWAMIWMVVSELLPDALEWAPKSSIATIVTIWITWMVLFQQLVW